MFRCHAIHFRHLICRIVALALFFAMPGLLPAQTTNPLTWDYVHTDSRYKESAHTLERGTDGQIIFSYLTLTVHFGVYTEMTNAPTTGKIYQGVRISNGAVQLYENGSLVAGQTASIGNNLAVRMERRGARLIVSVGSTLTGGPWTVLFTRATDPNKDWHPFLYNESGAHGSMVPLITFWTNKEGYQPDYFGNGLSTLNSLTATYFPRYDSLTHRQNWNWIYTRTFNGEGNAECHELGQSITYFDNLGRAVQTQSKDYTNNKVWVTQTIFDRFGRPAITTLPAPKAVDAGDTYAKLGYTANFVRSGETTGNAYGVSDFDDNNSYFSPNTVGNVSNTLGAWYYNTSATDDPGRPATRYPFVQVEYSPLTGAPRYSNQAGEAFKMTGAGGKYGRSFGMAAGNELTYVFGQRNPLALLSGSTVYDPSVTLALFTTTTVNVPYTKQVSADADGKQAVVFLDPEGREVARCLAGKVDGNNVKTQTTTLLIPAGEYRDIHVTDQGSPNTTLNISGGATYDIYNLESYHDFNTGLVASNQTASTQALSKGFYRVVNKSGGTTQCTLSYVLNYYNFTLNVHDLSGRLVATVPPVAVKYNLAANTATAPSYDNIERQNFTWYRYNSLGQLVWEQTPDGGNTRYYYRKDGKLRFSQSAQQLTDSKYSYTNYNSDGRINEAGEASLTGLNSVTTANSVLGGGVDASGLPVNGANASVKKVYIVTKYDEAYQTPSGKVQRNLAGRISYVEKIQRNESNGTYYTVSTCWYSYDVLGRKAWQGEYDGAIGVKYTDYTYDLLGNATEVCYQRGSGSDEFRHVYAFNNEGRLASVSTRPGTATLPELALEYSYYQTSRAIKSVKYHDNFREQVYSYTLQGQLKGINLSDAETYSTATGNQLFSLALDYYPDDFKFNVGDINTPPTESGATTAYGYTGLVGRQRWKTRATVNGANYSGVYAYTYKYNHRNELKEAQYATSVTGAPYQLNFGNSYREFGMTYDLNGNLTALSRNDSIGTTLESLGYNYIPNKNQLSNLTGTFNNAGGYLKVQGSGNYTYNGNGQLTDDVAENVRQEYDVYGRVVKVYERSSNLLKVEFVYNANGMRIRKIGYGTAGNATYTYYAYAGSRLMSIYEEVYTNNVSGGVVLKEVPVYGTGRMGVSKASAGYAYRWDLRDHLGNVRCTFGRGTGGGYNVLNVEYYAEYYAYGWTLPKRNRGTSRYGFQGAFAEKDAETGWTAFDLRQYDARVGRWMTIDPAEEFHSPYIAFGNNPAFFADFFGGTVEPLSSLQGAWLTTFTALRATNDTYNSYIEPFDKGPLKDNLHYRVGIGTKIDSDDTAFGHTKPTEIGNITTSRGVEFLTAGTVTTLTVDVNTENITAIGIVATLIHESIHASILVDYNFAETANVDHHPIEYYAELLFNGTVEGLTEYSNDNNLGLTERQIKLMAASGLWGTQVVDDAFELERGTEGYDAAVKALQVESKSLYIEKK